MSAPIPLKDIAVRLACPVCGYGGCRACNGRGWVAKDPYARRGGEQGDDFADVPRPAVDAEAFDAARADREQEECGHG